MTTGPSRQYVTEYLQAADETVLEAKALLDKGFPKGAANRAYYAIFYAVQAALGLVNVKKPNHRVDRRTREPSERTSSASRYVPHSSPIRPVVIAIELA